MLHVKDADKKKINEYMCITICENQTGFGSLGSRKVTESAQCFSLQLLLCVTIERLKSC